MADTVNASIVEHFQTLEDPRIERTKKHLLLDILIIAVCTLLTGGKGSGYGILSRVSANGSKPSWLYRMVSLPTIPLAASLLVSIPRVFRSAFCHGPVRLRLSRRALFLARRQNGQSLL